MNVTYSSSTFVIPYKMKSRIIKAKGRIKVRYNTTPRAMLVPHSLLSSLKAFFACFVFARLDGGGGDLFGVDQVGKAMTGGSVYANAV